MRHGPVEAKVVSAAIGGGSATAALTSFLVYVLGETVYAGQAVPAPVVGMVTIIIAWAAVYVTGFLAPHTPRPDLPAAQMAVTDWLTRHESGGPLPPAPSAAPGATVLAADPETQFQRATP